MRKAIGWMLREMGKRDKTLLLQFLDKYSKVMPRTMLRYSIEKLTDEERKLYMGRWIRIERRRNGLSEPEVRPVCNENVRQKNHWLELLPGENRWKTLYGI